MDLSAINEHLAPEMSRQREALAAAVCMLEPAIAAGVVRNRDYVQAKEIINRAVEEAAASFLDTGPHHLGRGRSDWWGYVYAAEAFIHGAHEIPVALRRAREHGINAYAAFIETALLPLHALLHAAKPMVKKKGEAGHPPERKTAEQIAREVAQMTCQCCGRRFLANLGAMAHHGYKRPGDGWQTASCDGAKELPFEVSRDVLGAMITRLKDWEADAAFDRGAIEAERLPVTVTYRDDTAPSEHKARKSVNVTRETFDAVNAEHSLGLVDFDKLKAGDVHYRDRKIAGVRDEIAAQQARYDGWKQTHQWSAASEKWQAIADG